MSSFKLQFFSTFPHEERDEVEKMLVRSVTHENDPIYFFLYQSRLAYLSTKHAGERLPDTFLETLGKHLQEARELKSEIRSGTIKKILLSRLATGFFCGLLVLAVSISAFGFINASQARQIATISKATGDLAASIGQISEQQAQLINSQKIVQDQLSTNYKFICDSSERIAKVIENGRGAINLERDAAIKKVEESTRIVDSLLALSDILKIPGTGFHKDHGRWGMIIPRKDVAFQNLYKDGVESKDIYILFGQP